MGHFPIAGRLLAGQPAHHFIFLLSAPRELDEEISADLADEVGTATLVQLVLRLWGLGGESCRQEVAACVGDVTVAEQVLAGSR